MRALVLRTVAAGLAVMLAGCLAPPQEATIAPHEAPEATCVAPDWDPSAESGTMVFVANTPGSFSYNGNAAARSGVEEYVWTNPSGAAQLSWNSIAASGSVTLVMLDACGATVFDHTLGLGMENLDKVTERGVPGGWLLRFTFDLFTSSMSLGITSA